MLIEIEAYEDLKYFIKDITKILIKEIKFKITIKRRNKYKVPIYLLDIKEPTNNDKLILLLLHHHFLSKRITLINKRGRRFIYPNIK